MSYTNVDVLNVARYMTGAAINQEKFDLVGGTAGYLVLDGGIKGGTYLWKNRKNFKNNGFFKTIGNSAKSQYQFEQSLKGKNLWQTAKNFWKYNETGIKPATTSAIVPSGSAATSATTAAQTTSKLAAAGKTAGKLIKGNALFAGISLAMATPEIIETYKELGATEGHKQVGRTLVNVAAETAGFAIGMKAGAAAGAAIGTCIPIPVVGTAVGAVIGAAIGFGVSYLAGRASRAIVGESGIQQARDYDAKVIALKAKFKEETKQQLLVAAKEKLTQDQESPNADTATATQSFNNIVESYA